MRSLRTPMMPEESQRIMCYRMEARRLGHALTRFERIDAPGTPYAAACGSCGAAVTLTRDGAEGEAIASPCLTAAQREVTERIALRVSRLPDPPPFRAWLRTVFPEIAAVTPDPASSTGETIAESSDVRADTRRTALRKAGLLTRVPMPGAHR